ncbi:branched-chain amino acid aminotransferase [Branchiibius hedensis]|uniref:Branched-chain amino acid aminotransferase n=2 Tax=Branchiibius hedensis TaxID=672460 RepID=A0A2Y8ZPJ5_9MICO|nr:branched-chain amino acid aminotransferase [Branchiibius hedensis]SSA33764.1 branched-chain amino acid aminotransferase [Branchiibius hedensis]
MSMRVWVNGRIVGDEPSLNALDHGVTVGDGVFETCKVVDSGVFALQRHHERLDRSLAAMGLPAADRGILDEAIGAVLEEPITFGRLRYTVTAGVGPMGSDRGDAPLSYVVAAAEAKPFAPTAKVVVVPWTRNERGALAGVKSTSYGENVLALARAKAEGGSEAIFANTRGELCEGTGSNIFVVIDGVAVTPPLTSGALAGITRALTLEAAAAAGIPTAERDLPIDVLDTCEEVFLTSTTRDIQPVHAVGERRIAAPGPVTTQLQAAFAEVSREMGVTRFAPV